LRGESCRERTDKRPCTNASINSYRQVIDIYSL
jgi:hypothetical protein